jgi:Helix-turn-helix domain
MSTASTGLSDWESSPILPAKWAGRLTFTVPEVGEILGISRWSAYQAALRGEIGVIEIGRRKVIPRRVVERMLTGQPAATAEGRAR